MHIPLIKYEIYRDHIKIFRSCLFVIVYIYTYFYDGFWAADMRIMLNGPRV